MVLNLEFLKENFRILFRRAIEYKVNFYSFSFVSFIYFLTTCVFISTLYLNFKDLIGWSFNAFIFYLIFLTGSKAFLAQFSTYKKLKEEILSGRLNSLIHKPQNILFQHIFNSSNLFGLFDIIIYSTATVIFLIYINFTLSLDLFRLFITFIFTMFGFIFHFLLFRTLEATYFFIKNNDFLIQFFVQPYRSFTNYPVVMFEGGIKTFAYLMPNVYYGAYATSFLFGYITYLEMLKLFIILLILIIIFGFFLTLFWKFGLKKYEAFG